MILAPPPAAAAHRTACHSASRWRNDCCCVTLHSRSWHRRPRMSRRHPASGRTDCPHEIASVSRRALITICCWIPNVFMVSYAYKSGTSAHRLFRPMTKDRCWPKWPMSACRRSSALSGTRTTSCWRNSWYYEGMQIVRTASIVASIVCTHLHRIPFWHIRTFCMSLCTVRCRFNCCFMYVVTSTERCKNLTHRH